MNVKMLSAEAIALLKSEGYAVQVMYDGDPELYGWVHKSGASQRDWKDRQPFRRTAKQARADCQAYVDGDVPPQARPDWEKQ